MDQRPGAVTILFSPFLTKAGFQHGFGTRGTAPDEYPEDIHFLSQVHGERIVVLSRRRKARDAGYSENPDLAFRSLPVNTFRFDDGDAMITDAAGTSIGIRTADCLPVLIGDTASGAVAAIHCGWRSLALGLAGKVMRTLVDIMGSDPSVYSAAMGPSIGPCCYEVGGDVRESFEPSLCGNNAFLDGEDGNLYMDLGEAAKVQLTAAGMVSENIERVEGCTMCDRELFWSYRAGDETERMTSWITAK
jgi:YfiH family protein